MKRINILYSSADETPEKILNVEGPPLKADLSALEKFYTRRGLKEKIGLDEFLNYWENEAAEKLLRPAARVVFMPTADAEEKFGAGIVKTNDSVAKAAMMVWTIGPGLEKEAGLLSSDKENTITGFLLDIAGSIALHAMHDQLIRWLKDECACRDKLYINGEFYPGMGSLSKDLLENISKTGDTEKLIGVSAPGGAFFRPGKTQCSLIALGSADNETTTTARACEPCRGRKCLYYQLGGCHMQNMI